MPDLAPGEDLRIGAGIIRFKLDDDSSGEWRDLGEFSNFEVTPEVNNLDYKSNKLGTKKVVKSVVTGQKATLAMTLNTISADNLALALGGTVSTVGTGHQRFGFMSTNVIAGQVRLEGTNDVGKKIDYTASVEVRPEGSYSPISEEWNELGLSGEVIADDDGNFGFYDIRDTGVAYSPPDLDASA